ncbi:MAG: hypothetical protein LBK24_01265, partial [Puniceicoccales bacterium]|nr:hypothetical protein [Puniceicoccales bacterium]
AKPGDQREVEAVAEKTSTDEVKLQDEAAWKDAMDAAWENANIDSEIDELVDDGASERIERLMRRQARCEFDAVLKGDPTAFREAQDRALDIVWKFGEKAEQENAWAEANCKIAKIEREFLRVKNKMAVTSLGKASVVCEEIHKEAKNAFDAESERDPEAAKDASINAAIDAAWRVAENALVRAIPEAIRAIPGLNPETQNALVEQLCEEVNRGLAEKTPAALAGVLAGVTGGIRSMHPETEHI